MLPEIIELYFHNDSAMKRGEILPAAITWMKLEGIILSKISQREKDRYYVILLMYGIYI